MDNNENYTVQFSIKDERAKFIENTIAEVTRALKEKGYNPINQLVGYILSADPTYITSYKDARKKIKQIERDELIEEFIKNYMKDLNL